MTVFPETIPELLDWRAARAAKTNAHDAWLRFEGDTWTLRDVVREVDHMAVGLAERGVAHGDVVAILVGNDAMGRRWFATGDLVRRDAHGLFTFVSRKKEVLRRRGENVAAAEIESTLTAHPFVLEAAVIGVPSSLGEDDIVAFVVLANDNARESAPDPEALRAFVRERLADFKVPSRIHLLAALPRTATERVARYRLRESDRG